MKCTVNIAHALQCMNLLTTRYLLALSRAKIYTSVADIWVQYIHWYNHLILPECTT